MFTRAFWKATFERLTRTFAQGTLGAISADGLGIVDVDWGDAFSVGGLAAALALLTAIATSGAGQPGPGITETAGPTGPGLVSR